MGDNPSKVSVDKTDLASQATIAKKDELLEEKFQSLAPKGVPLIIEEEKGLADHPEILAHNLSLDESNAHMISLPKEEVKNYQQPPKENPPESPQYTVPTYLESEKNGSLTKHDKVAIKERLKDGFSITEIAKELKLSEKEISEYVENKLISFKGKDGVMVLDIINKCFKRTPIAKLKEMIAKKDLKLQENICFELEKDEYTTVKDYFRKFEDSQNFFEIDDTFSVEAKTCIRASTLDNVEELSQKLNRMERLIRDYLLQYSPDLELLSFCEQEQLKQIEKMKNNFGGEMRISHTTYRMIISDSFDNLIEKAKKFNGSPVKILIELLPLVFYYIKCSLPLDELTHIISNATKISLTTLDIFHLIFQMSDPVVRGLCIEHYSFSNPVPFYYPILGLYPPEQTSCQFEICKELWYSLQQFSGLVSFGLGWASWNLIGKSHLLDLMFKTDFVKGSPQNSPFHLGSIDIQMTKNLFGLKDSSESTQWAYIDCHKCSDIHTIQDIYRNLDIALIHVSYSDYTENYLRLMEGLKKIASHTEHVYVLIRDCAENNLKTEQVALSANTLTFIFIPNLIKCNNKEMSSSLKNLGYTILHLKIASPKFIESNFLQNLITQNESWMNLEKEKKLIEQIKNHICEHTQDTRNVDFSALSYYPHFVNYMHCFYETSSKTDQREIDELNRKCEQLANHLEKAEMNVIVWQFNDILSQENSALILWKLSQVLATTNSGINQVPYTLEIFWREALLSSKFNTKISQDRQISQYFEIFSSNFSNHVERGEPFELIDGDNLRFFNQDINALLSKFYEQQYDQTTTLDDKSPPLIVSIFGPQSSGKSTLLNYCFGCKFLTSAGRCTKGIYASLSKLSQPINDSEHFLILDTEGLDAIERGKNIQDTSCIHFDRTMVLFCLAVSQVVIINVKGDIGEEMRNLLQICAYSLNKLKVSKVAAPKIFFVLNQQADPDPNKHLSSINTLLRKLNEESDLMETEGLKISDLIEVSEENLFVLPSAFNSESLNTQMTKLFDSKLCKSSPTVNFADKCTDLRVSITQQLENDTQDCHDKTHKTILFNTMGEWLEMSGVIWDTIIKYQDIVKYRNVEELKCSISLSKILSDIMKHTIHFSKKQYCEITEKLILRINKISELSPPKTILEDVKEELDDIFKEHQNKALTDFKAHCQDDSLLKKMDYMCDEAKSNLSRLIYMEKKIYEDKLKFEIKAKLTELEITENMKNFQQAIEKNADEYFDLSIEEQTAAFEGVWLGCFRRDSKNEEDNELDEMFDGLYSVFRMESKTIENKQTIYSLFRKLRFEMDNIIQFIGQEMLKKFCKLISNFSESDHFIFPWKENRVPIREMTPYVGKEECEYLSKDSFYSDENQGPKPDLKFREWIPSECYPLIKYCSGYYNHPDIIWRLEKRKQILLLASQLKDPNDSERSTWDKFIYDISERVQYFTGKDPNISHSTVKEIVNSLCHICKAMNYEINFIEAKLTNAAERMISTYAFALALKPLLETKTEKQREKNSNENKSKELNLKYFLQKVENQKMARGNWDRKKMREGDQTIAEIFAKNFLAAVWRGVRTACEQSIDEKYFDVHRDELSHESILLLANERIKEEFSRDPPFDENNFVVQFICDQKQNMKTLFQEEWYKIANKLRHRIFQDMKDIFTKHIVTLQSVLTEMLDRLVTMCKKSKRLEPIGLDSDSNFEVADIPSTEVVAGDSDSKAKVLPLKAMVLYLEMYLDPNVSPERFREHFSDVFEVDGVKLKKHHDTYVLSEKPHYPALVLDLFKKLTDTNMFRTTETIFNIKSYLQEFLDTVNDCEYEVTEAEYENLLKDTKEKFEARIINCPYQCPSCGKFCEREIHPHAGKCQIMTGHQICSMGGKVWNNNEDRTAILLMCDDYDDDTEVLIPGQNMNWGQFKEKCGDQWDWTLPTDKKYVTLQEVNRNRMIDIWNKFGREILKYYGNRGTKITYIPYTSAEDIYTSLFLLKYYVCFVIDGTNLMDTAIFRIKKKVSDVMRSFQLKGTSKFKIIVYHGHDSTELVEKFPNNSEFILDQKSIENFLENITTYGDEKSEFPMLHGLATAAKESNWELGFEIKNIIFHSYVEPTNEYFDIFTAKGKCGQGCEFDWERDISDRMHNMKIQYKNTRFIPQDHRECRRTTPITNQTPSRVNLISKKKFITKPTIFIDYKTDN